MGKTNRLASNERKLSALLGEQQQLRDKIALAQKILNDIENMKKRIGEIDELVELGEKWIKTDDPDWTSEHLKPKVPFVHAGPIRFGNGSRLALAIVREAYHPMTVREVATEACRREGIDDIEPDNLDRLVNTMGRGLSAAKKRGVPVDHDHGYPARWFSTVEATTPPIGGKSNRK